MVTFAELKTGDTIARRYPKLDGDKLIHTHGPTYTVRSAVTNPCGGTRSVWVGVEGDNYGYWMHDLQFSTIDDELKGWDKI